MFIRLVGVSECTSAKCFSLVAHSYRSWPGLTVKVRCKGIQVDTSTGVMARPSVAGVISRDIGILQQKEQQTMSRSL